MCDAPVFIAPDELLGFHPDATGRGSRLGGSMTTAMLRAQAGALRSPDRRPAGSRAVPRRPAPVLLERDLALQTMVGAVQAAAAGSGSVGGAGERRGRHREDERGARVRGAGRRPGPGAGRRLRRPDDAPTAGPAARRGGGWPSWSSPACTTVTSHSRCSSPPRPWRRIWAAATASSRSAGGRSWRGRWRDRAASAGRVLRRTPWRPPFRGVPPGRGVDRLAHDPPVPELEDAHAEPGSPPS